jgi:hypothetical protein
MAEDTHEILQISIARLRLLVPNLHVFLLCLSIQHSTCITITIQPIQLD